MSDRRVESSTDRRLPPGNPFASRAVRPGAIDYFFAGDENVALLANRLEHADGWGQIVGPHGTGKSTLLEQLLPIVLERGRKVHRITLHDRQRRLPAEFLATLDSVADDGVLVVVDGYEQLSWLSRWSLKRRCRRLGCGLLVTSHADVGLPTLYETSASGPLARQVVERLLTEHDPHDTQNAASQIDLADLDELLVAHGGNMRSVLFDLYDRYERRGP